VKGLAHELKLNANTVARVYRDLEREGVIDTTPDAARSSAKTASSQRRAAPHGRRDPAVDDAVREARSLAVTLDEIRAITDASIGRWFPEEQK